MKTKTTNIPEWFHTSKSFTESKKTPDYSVFPSFTLPSNRVAANMFRTDTDAESIINQKHPLERIGFNLFYGNHGGLTNYPGNKLIHFTDLGYNSSDPTNESYWSFNFQQYKIAWINGEIPIGYDGQAVIGIPSKKNKLLQILGAAKLNNPDLLICIYSWESIHNIRVNWYNLDSGSIYDAETLYDLLNNPNNIITPQIDAGCNAIMQQVYSSNNSYYDWIALLILQSQLIRKKHGYNYPFFPLIWSLNESLDGYPTVNIAKYRRPDGTFINLEGFKQSAPPEYMYNFSLISMLFCNGFISWENIMTSIVSEKDINEPFGEDVDNNIIQTTIGNETWSIENSRTWQSNYLFSILGLYQISQNKDIVEDTSHEWFHPDFSYKNNPLRTGKFKTIPYNKLYKEPIVLMKYNQDETEAFVFIMNCWETNFEKVPITFTDTTKNITITLPQNGRKAELYRVEL
jgi:hypothetical protein